jgi:hypothetical protein
LGHLVAAHFNADSRIAQIAAEEDGLRESVQKSWIPLKNSGDDGG